MFFSVELFIQYENNKAYTDVFYLTKIQRKRTSNIPIRAFLLSAVPEGILNIVFVAATHIILKEKKDRILSGINS